MGSSRCFFRGFPLIGFRRSRVHVVVKGKKYMLWTIALILVVLWILGLVSSYTIGGFIHILLVIAIVMVLFNIIGRRGR